jgi:geranylgeranyl diphosphate synthase type II
MLGSSWELAMQPACTLEFVHTYSLIHDDLPCMDDDDLRRGKPTLHKTFPEGHAVLTGDYLLTQAFALLSTSPGLLDTQRIKLTSILAQRSGSLGMIGGQVMDLTSEGKPIDFATLQQIHARKTAAMISASVEFGAIVANAPAEVVNKLQTYGNEIGLAFQIVDDILDVTADDEQLGKPAGSDIANDKITYVSLLGLESARKCAMNHCQSALSVLKEIDAKTDVLEFIAEKVINRTS